MCGVGVLVASRASSTDVAPLIGPYLRVVRHRGPDDEGFALWREGERGIKGFAGEETPEGVRDALARVGTPLQDIASSGGARVALGHERLAILDVSPSGHQPMLSADGRYAIVYNGEVYNFESLRAELVSLGHEFVSQTDTEVVLHAYMAWGARALARFNGMFAFSIFDAHERKLFAARDRFGIKPLYMWCSPNGLFALASEIKQLALLPGFGAKLNAQRAYDFLNWGLADHTPETLFAGVAQLQGGEYIECAIDALGSLPKPVRWYELGAARGVGRTFEDASQEMRELFLDAVHLRMRADVPVGTALSGGLDSSSIVCAVNSKLRTNGGARQRSYSACSHVARFDERHFVDRVVAATSVDAHYVYTTVSDLFESLDAITWHQDEPFGGTSVFAEWAVFRLVASTPVRVTLDGHGADELLGGYPTFFGPRLLDLIKRGRTGELAREVAGIRKNHGYGPLAISAAILSSALPSPYLELMRRATGRVSQRADWFRHTRLGVSRDCPGDAYYRPSQNVEGYSIAQLVAMSLPVQLHWADRDSMAHSVESRMPFLDYRLVEYVLGCPPDFKIRGGVTKAMLRTAMSGLLPPEIEQRRDKMGFVTAEEHWALSEATDLFRSEVDRACEIASGVVNERARDRAIAILDGKERFNLFFWRLISFARWMQQFEVAA